MRIAVFGARGQLGSVIVHEFRQAHDVSAFDHAAVDITDSQSVAAAFDRGKPDVAINCVGYNAVDASEDHPVDALRVNAFAVRTLARAARAHGSRLVHYSSDFVFDGMGQQPHTEDEPPNPLSVYATSKLLGEWFALDSMAIGGHAYVLRVESLFGRVADGPPAKGSAATIVSALQQGSTPTVFEDRTVSPTNVFDAARATRELIEREASPGLYHCVNTGSCTWLEFAQEAARLLSVEAKLNVVRFADMKFRASRPLYCAMSNAKLASVGITMPTWQDALARHVRGIRLPPPR